MTGEVKDNVEETVLDSVLQDAVEVGEPAATEPATAAIEEEENKERTDIKLENNPDVIDDDDVTVVVWEATVTGRRLIDEMINIGSYSESQGVEKELNEYVMPYGKLPLNVIRNYNLRIVDTGRYRMLKEIRNNKMLKSKSEVAACNEFAAWLGQIHRASPAKKIVIVYFEPRHSKILQLFQALERYRLLDDIKSMLLGCVNGWDLMRQQVHDLRDEHRMVLRALTDHHLTPDTPLESALQRAKAIHKILVKVHGDRIKVKTLKENMNTCDFMLEQVKKIKEELIKEAQWRPVFAEMFRQGIKPRRRAGFLRHLLVESGITYSDIIDMFKDKKDDGIIDLVKEKVKGKNEADTEEMIKLLNQHLSQPEKQMRRGSGRRGPRTRSLCVSEMEKLAIKNEEENNNEMSSNSLAHDTPVAIPVTAEVP